MGITNAEIGRLFDKYAHLQYKPLGMYFASELPDVPKGKIRVQHILPNWCIPATAFAAARHGKISVVSGDRGCVGGRWWTGFSHYPPRGISVFLAKGGVDNSFGGRGERIKKTPALGACVIKNPGPVKQPPGTRYICFQRLREIPDDRMIEYVLFFCKPNDMLKIVSFIHFGRSDVSIVRAPAGSGCQGIVTFPLLMAEEPVPDAVMGMWDPLANRRMPKHMQTIAVRRWLVAEFAPDIPETYVNHVPVFTLRSEIPILFKKAWKSLHRCKELGNGTRSQVKQNLP
jgi:uncharacterized protein (DUF169 family)